MSALAERFVFVPFFLSSSIKKEYREQSLRGFAREDYGRSRRKLEFIFIYFLILIFVVR